MNNIIRLECRKCIVAPAFILSVMLMSAVMIGGCYADFGVPAPHGGWLYLLGVTTSVGIGHVLIPVFSVLPSAFVYRSEVGGNLYFNLIRSNQKRYVVSKIIASVFSGVLCILLSVIILLLFASLNGVTYVGDGLIDFKNTDLNFFIAIGWTWMILVFEILVLLACAAVWPMIALAISAFSYNQYLIFTGPLIIYLVMNYLGELSGLLWICPGEYTLETLMVFEPFGGIPECLFYYGILTILATLLFVMKFRERMRNG